ncbi:hypothetical protein B0O99DRAFT_525415 [Bisporella sp. PMI_857]|nr:hypothetical protein B0O99DRAFT_525415 [Bisporella sp. PMI_857]
MWASIWYLPITIFALWNLKALPLVWHIRLYSVMIKHFVTRKSENVTFITHGGSAIFEPIITTTSCPLLEIDMNLHKSNSTFFLDLDINRVHLLVALFKPVLSSGVIANPSPHKKLGELKCMLGAVSCHFRREIKPLEKYEVWTRVLCWDKKWLYIVSHFVTKGETAPVACKQRSSKREPEVNRRRQSRENEGNMPFQMEKSRSSKLIRASALSKYVFKQGRRTKPPEEVMKELNLIPPPPDHIFELAKDCKTTEDSQEIPYAEWDWHRIQQENERGLKIASQFDGMDALHETFSGDSSDALGYYSDWPW